MQQKSSAANPLQVSVASWNRYIKPMKLTPGALLTGRELLRDLGLPTPLPPFLKRILDISDELDMRIRTEPYPGLLKQWNGLFGQWMFDASPVVRLRGSENTTLGRSISDAMDRKAEGVYRVTHETAHGIIGEIGLRGLLRVLDEKENAQTPSWNYHVFGEAFAGFVSHYELGVSSYSYWKKHWRPVAERSEFQPANVGQAAIRAGLSTPKQRAELILATYFSNFENTGKIRLEKIVNVPELAEMWTTERNYALKTRAAAKAWWTHYWSHKAIRSFIKDFINNEPAVVYLGKRAVPHEIASVSELGQMSSKIFWDWSKPPAGLAPQLSARRRVQRNALAVCQLMRLIEHPGLICTDSVRGQLTGAVNETRARLFDEADRVVRVALGSVDKTESQRVIERAENLLQELTQKLKKITGGEGILQTHPGVYGLDLTDGWENFDPKFLQEDTWPQDHGAQIGLLQKCVQTVRRFSDDTRDVYRITRKSELKQEAMKLASLLTEGTIIQEVFNSDDARAYCEKTRAWYREAIEKKTLVLCYQWNWLFKYPFVDPLIGYRVA